MFEFAPTATEWLFWNALALIVAACLFAPLLRSAGLGTILGYIAAGLAVQLLFPGTIAAHPEELLHFSEFGVVLFLFVIGLELRPQELWHMRLDIFGLGFVQMLFCGLLLALASTLVLDVSPAVAAVVGLGLALSSTALVMQMLDEHNDRATHYGRKTFAVLLFQDLAIVPLLLLVTLLAPADAAMSWQQSLAALAQALLAIGLLIGVGRFLLDPMFSLLARTRMPELMTAGALGVVIAAALLMDLVGMSYAMGSFIAGVMLAESVYRHEVEANIEPFRGLFLGLFFMAVGMSLNLQVVQDNWLLIVLVAAVGMLIKLAALYLLGRLFGSHHNDSVRLGLALPQHGEFAFVLFAAAATAGLFSAQLSALLIAVVTVSMVLSPLLLRLQPLLLGDVPPTTIEESFSDAGGRILIIGFGRFGQVLSQPLFARGLQITILDNDAGRIVDAERFGFRVHFGDGRRREVLQAAGAADTDLIVICTNDPQANEDIVALVQSVFPGKPCYVRSYDRRQSIRFLQMPVEFSVRETFESALRLGEVVLGALGTQAPSAQAIIADVRERDLDRLRAQAAGDMRSGLDRLHTAPVVAQPIGPKGEHT